MGPTYKDYYAILGIDKTVGEKEIKAAFRKLARKWHPDVNPGDKAAEEKFKEINEANEVLSDPDKRKKYDQYGEQWRAYSQGGGQPSYSGYGAGQQGFPGGFRVDNFGGGDLNDLFASLFGGDFNSASAGGFSNARGGREGFGTYAQRKGQDVESSVTVTLEEAFAGATKSLALSIPTGRYDMGSNTEELTSRRVEVKIPAGVTEGQKIRLSGQGTSGMGGNGDLYLIVKIAAHAQFERTGDDITVEIAVPYTTAILGGEVRVPTLKGTRLTMNVPMGTQAGQRFKLTGQGMPRLKGGGAGDLYARIKITVPKTVTDRERELLSELKALSVE